MSTKEWISDLTNGAGVYQECIYDSDYHVVNPNPAVIQLDQSADTAISQKVINDELGSRFTLEASIPATTFDRIAMDWCKKRSLNTNKYKLEELLSRNNVPQRYHTGESTKVLEETLGDFEYTQTIKERSEQPEIEAALEMDNIFSMLTSDAVEAGYLQECSNELLQLRDDGRNLSQKYPILSKIVSKEEHAKALILMEMLLEDYDNNLLLIDALSCSIARFEADDDASE
jgi:hypothetical protein